MNSSANPAAGGGNIHPAPARLALWLVLLAAAGTCALTMGTRQAIGLFLSPLNTVTGLGLGSIMSGGVGRLMPGAPAMNGAR